MKLGINDIMSLLWTFQTRQEAKLFHTFNDDSKTFVVTPKDAQGGGYFAKITQNDREVNILLSDQEANALWVMLQAALPLIHNWK